MSLPIDDTYSKERALVREHLLATRWEQVTPYMFTKTIQSKVDESFYSVRIKLKNSMLLVEYFDNSRWLEKERVKYTALTFSRGEDLKLSMTIKKAKTTRVSILDV